MRFGPDPIIREPDPALEFMPPIVKPSAFFTNHQTEENQMSYSFSITANTGGEAPRPLVVEIRKVVERAARHTPLTWRPS